MRDSISFERKNTVKVLLRIEERSFATTTRLMARRLLGMTALFVGTNMLKYRLKCRTADILQRQERFLALLSE
jgi:hypothetical protein